MHEAVVAGAFEGGVEGLLSLAFLGLGRGDVCGWCVLLY